MKALIKIANNVNIMGIGEATHGQNKIDKYRTKIFKNLVKKCNYRVFVLEDNYAICEQVNDYIHGKPGDLRTIMGSLMWPWQSIHMYNLIEWMRQYNQKHDGLLDFHGIDIQYDSGYRNADGLFNFVDGLRKQYQISEQQHKQNFRDHAMFQIFMKLYSAKTFICAHNGHLEKDTWDIDNVVIKPLGAHLSEQFGEKYYVVGNTFYAGSYIGYNPEANKMEIAIISLNRALDTGLYFHKNKLRDLIMVDGSAYASESAPMQYIYLVQYDHRFDALLVINDETPRRLIK